MLIFTSALPKSPRYTVHGNGWGMAEEAQDILVANIVARLVELGLDDQEFARAVGVDKTIVSKWLRKKPPAPIRIKYFDKIAAALAMQVWQLFEDPKRRGKIDIETALRVVVEHVRATRGTDPSA